MAENALLRHVKRIMYGDSPAIMDLVTKQMYGYDSKTTATGKQPDEVDLSPTLPDTFGFTQEHVAFTFGRFSVPSTGHAKLIERVIEEANGGPHYIFATHGQDSKSNPLSFETKVAFMEACWPDATIYENKDVKTLFDALKKFDEAGFSSATLVVGADRFKTFQDLLERYSDEFKLTCGIVAVERSDDDVSATKMREAVLAEDFETFASMVPSDDRVFAEYIYRAVGEKLERPKASLKEQVKAIMKTAPVPIPGGGEADTERTGLDNLGSKKDAQIKRRAARKRFVVTDAA